MFQLEVSSGSRLDGDYLRGRNRKEEEERPQIISLRNDLAHMQNIYNAATNNSTTIRSQLTQHSQLHKTTFKRTEDIEVFKLNFGWNKQKFPFF